MTWRRFADAMPPEQKGVQIAVWTGEHALMLTWESDTLPATESFGWWREADFPFQPAEMASRWTHWLLIEPPAEEG